MGTEELENDQRDTIDVDVLDFRRLRETVEHIEQNTRGGKIRRILNFAVWFWAIGVSGLLIATYQTLQQALVTIEKLELIIKSMQ